jgi:hypothetical protein
MRPQDPDDEPTHDPELQRLLEEWTVPAVPDTLDRRVRASFRAQLGRAPLWKRLLTTSVRIPLPVAVAALLLLAFALWRSAAQTAVPVESAESMEPARTAQVETQPVVTRTSLAGFEPVSEMNVTVVSQSSSLP